MSRIPIRIRLTLAFALALGVVLAALGFVVYTSFEDSLNDNTDQALRARATDIAALIEREGPRLPGAGDERFGETEDSFTQVLDAEGRVVDGTILADTRALLSPAEIERAREGSLTITRDDAVEEGDPARIFAVPVDGHTLVVGQATDDNEESLATLALPAWARAPGRARARLPAGYAVAAAALQAGRGHAQKGRRLSARTSPGERLPIPPAHDEISRLGETLNAMLARLEAAIERERGFVADASHELRTPLASLKTELELALRRDRTDGRAARRASLRDRGDRPPESAWPTTCSCSRGRTAAPAAHESSEVPARELLDRVASAVPHERRTTYRSRHPTASTLQRRPAAARAGARKPRRERRRRTAPAR